METLPLGNVTCLIVLKEEREIYNVINGVMGLVEIKKEQLLKGSSRSASAGLQLVEEKEHSLADYYSFDVLSLSNGKRNPSSMRIFRCLICNFAIS